MANDVVARLETLSEQLAAATSPAESQNAIEQALSYLRAKHTTAEENNYTNLEPWLAQIVADLEAVASDAETTALSLPLSETSSHSAEVEVGPEAPPLLAGLNEIVPDLLKLPSLQPANALRLPRNIRQTFALQSDTLPSLLTSLQPQLKDTLYPALANLAVGRPTRVQSVQALRVKAAPFGHNAPLKPSYKDDGSVTYSEWGLEPVDTSDKKRIFLDSEYDQILPDSWITIERTPIDGTQKQPEYFQVQEVATVSRADYGISGKVTRLTLNREWPVTDTDTDAPNLAVLRGVTVYAQGETLTPVDVPVEDDVAGDTITLDALYDGLEAGRWLVVSGERTDTPATQGVMGGELVMLAGVTQSSQTTGDQPHTTLKLANALSYTYKRESVTIYGNVVKATHGETREEVLGSGNGSQARQQFELKKSPLTYLAAPTPDGRESTLEVRVNHIRWHEADNLFALESTERGYSTRTDNEGTVTVTFGDGTHGARLPSGTENVRATYRKGIGKPGNVNAEQISMLATKPLGVKGVRNPLPASGGANREPRDQARRNAPLAVMALDRLVSVRDYADFARTFAGIGKASAVELSDGGRRVVHLTIAGADDIPVDPTSDLYRNLRRALLQYGDPHQPLQIDVRELKLLVISASVRVQPDYAWEFVAPEIRAALLDTFSFQRRELGQDVMRAEVISTIEQVPGVAYVDLDILHSIGGQLASTLSDFDQLFKTLNTEQQPRPRIVARTAAINRQATRPDERITPAQMIYLSTEVPDTLILKLKDG
jgi:predicted phage baseplate assembly protein